MSTANRICHDLKSERSDIGQPLPGALRLLPVAFYAALVGSIALCSFFFLKLRSARAAKEQFVAAEKQETKAAADLDLVIDGVKEEVKKAEEVVGWIEGTRPVQVTATTIIRSMGTDSTIGELALERQENNPAQLRMGLKLNPGRGGGIRQSEQIEETVKALQDLNYRAYGAQKNQAKETGALQYSATLIYQETNG